MDPSRRSAARETISEGAAEVKEKLREDLSRWSRARRFVSLKHEIPCLECDGAGRIQCHVCGGTGKSRLVLEDGTQEPCVQCDGRGSITCVVCTGKGQVPNAHRKTMLWLMVAGGLAWLFILFQLWGRDILPEQRAAVLQRGEHGKAVSAPQPGPLGAGRGVVVPSTGGASAGNAVTPTTPQWQQRGQNMPPPAPGGYSGAPTLQPGMAGQPGMGHGNSVPSGGSLGQGTGYGQPAPGVVRPYGGNSLPSSPGR
jgi:hypothetical protein